MKAVTNAACCRCSLFSRELIEAMLAITSGHNFTLCSATNKSSACCHCSPFSQALIEALQVMTSRSNSTLCSSTNKSSAYCRCSPFSQALIAALLGTEFGNTSGLPSKPSACCHCSLFSQAIEVLQVMTSGSNSTLCSATNKSSACCHCSTFSQALIAVLYDMAYGNNLSVSCLAVPWLHGIICPLCNFPCIEQ